MTIGRPTGFDSALASDGVDEVLTVMYGGWPGWATFSACGSTGRILSIDTGASWDFEPGRFAGTSPSTGRAYDEPTLRVSPRPPPGDPDFTFSGSAAALDAWLWRRQVWPDPMMSGDAAGAEEFLAVVAVGVA